MSEPLPLADAQRRRGKPGRPRKERDAKASERDAKASAWSLKIAAVLPMAPRLLGEEDAGRYAGVSRWSIRAWIESGKLPTVKLPGVNGDMRRVLVDRADLDKLIEHSRMAAREGLEGERPPGARVVSPGTR